MELFIDTANIKQIKIANEYGIISGVTTNPTLISKENQDFVSIIKEIANIIDGPISAEVLSLDFDNMLAEANNLAKIHPNIVIKIPMTLQGLKVVSLLKKQNIKTNVTLIFNSLQALLASRAGATYISPFLGRLDDIGQNGLDLIKEIVQIFCCHNISTKIIAASIRNPMHVLESAKLGAHIATIPFNIIEQLSNHPLTTSGIEKFLEDSKNQKIIFS